jgi:hypothetical protein
MTNNCPIKIRYHIASGGKIYLKIKFLSPAISSPCKTIIFCTRFPSTIFTISIINITNINDLEIPKKLLINIKVGFIPI